ncbi:MAG: hypothetical protein MI922_20520 [Bacteroidales bacterium]|nr:hypothetical protein [Bacteroidales bacterium]
MSNKSKHFLFLLIPPVVVSVFSIIIAIVGNENVLVDNIVNSFHVNFYFFILLVISIVAFTSFHHLAKSKWIIPFENLRGNYFFFTIIMFCLFVPTIFGAYPANNNNSLTSILSCKWFIVISTLFILVVTAMFLKNEKARSSFKSSLLVVSFFIGAFVLTLNGYVNPNPHFHSTLMFWFVISGSLLSATAVFTLLFVYKNSEVSINAKYYKDLGRYLFSFSCLWMYLWFSQYLLIWYTNIPHESFYIRNQQEFYPVLFYTNLILNSGIPFVLLISPQLKLNNKVLKIAAISVLAGQFLNTWILINSNNQQNYSSLVIALTLYIVTWLSFYYYSFKFRPHEKIS